ncbi:MAG: DUF4430 domain-containing protein [Patescibacteria group bacterium]
MRKNLKLIIFLALLLIVALIFWQVPRTIKNQNETIGQLTGQEQGQISIIFNFGDDKKISLAYPYSDQLSTNLFTITESVAAKQAWTFNYADYSTMGRLITQINDKINGRDNKYWQYYINDILGQVGASQYMPKVGDQIEWRFETANF